MTSRCREDTVRGQGGRQQAGGNREAVVVAEAQVERHWRVAGADGASDASDESGATRGGESFELCPQ